MLLIILATLTARVLYAHRARLARSTRAFKRQDDVARRVSLPPALREDALRALDESMLLTYRVLARHPGARLHEAPDHAWFASGAGVPELDAVVRAVFPADVADARASEVARAFRAVAAEGGGWWVGPLSRPRDLPRRLTAIGFTWRPAQVGMALDLAPWSPRPARAPAGARVERVTGGAPFRAWMRAFAPAFGFDEAARERWARVYATAARDDRYRHYACVMGEETVSVASLVMDDASAGLYNVGTPPAHRRRGYARAVLEHALADARDAGHRLVVLHAAPDGVALYRGLGFADVAPVAELAMPARRP